MADPHGSTTRRTTTVAVAVAAVVVVIGLAALVSADCLLIAVGALAAGALLVAALGAGRTTRAPANDDDMLARTTQQRDALEVQRDQLQHNALHDPVTGLANRSMLQTRATELGDGLAGSTLLLLDLDGFKEVNDTLGHARGDDLLRQVGQRVSGCVRAQDTVARLCSDEFVVLLPQTSQWNATQTAERVLETTRKPFTVAGKVVQARGSIGIAHADTSSDLAELLKRADVAMYAAKGAGRDRCAEFTADMMDDVAERVRFDAEMRQALLHGDFRVYYQPIVDSRSGRVVSLEALVRWDRAELGVASPADFLPAAERSGLIVELGQFVLRTACEQTAQWRRRWPDVTIAVNASHSELLNPEFGPQVAGLLASTGLSSTALYVEVTETVLAAEEEIQSVLSPLSAMGVQSALDDFGTGHSSLSRLGHLRVDRVKIDRSFVMNITDARSEGAALLTSIIGLAHSVGLTVVAEGVETLDQAELLADAGCEELQGFYFARPLPANQIAPLMEAREAAAPAWTLAGVRRREADQLQSVQP